MQVEPNLKNENISWLFEILMHFQNNNSLLHHLQQNSILYL